ncbi:MAG TPA: M23 family metallopeptidase, partial [Bacteroidales bacterium]|nr:M23 family metallopeptidase [Bacteroidales bacterium]
RDGSSLFDYYIFNKPVVAPADGWIQEVVDHVEDNNPGEVNLEQNWGNTVIIKHTENLYSKVSHLKKQSILYPKGTYVSKGQVIAQSGNSGRSPFPHLHFQIQANPYIGSATIMYPIAQFIRFNGKHELIISGYPEKDEQITNIQPNAWLEKAFKFIPGQVISFMVNGTEGKWLIEADMYNNTSVRCLATNSVAWFRINGNIFYFTHFEGDRNSVLYYFYMSAYQVPLCYYPDLEVKDVFPPTIVPYSFIKAVQDFTAPFWLFIKPEYKSTMAQNNQHTPELTLLSECTFKFLRRNIINLQTEMIITENGITQLNIMDKGRKLSLSFFREDK